MLKDIQAALKEVTQPDQPGRIEARFCFDGEHPFFAGHFPGRPLLPGIFQIGLVREAAAASTGIQYDLVRVVKAKFLDEVRPGETIRVEAVLSEDKDPRISATLWNSRGLAGKVSLVLRAHGPEPLVPGNSR